MTQDEDLVGEGSKLTSPEAKRRLWQVYQLLLRLAEEGTNDESEPAPDDKARPAAGSGPSPGIGGSGS